jgi:predicted RNase H-like HicB family nuclease
MKLTQFLVVIEKGKTNFGAYSPDLPGCVAVGKTRRAAEKSMYEAITLHIEGMLEDGLPIPRSQSSATYSVHEVPSQSRQRNPANGKSARIARRV